MTINKRVLERLKDGDEQAFESIYRAYSGRIYGFLLSTLGDCSSVAEDLLQTFFLKLWEGRSHIDLEKDFNSYLFTIARHLVYKELNKRLTHSAITLLEEIDIDVEDDNRADRIIETESLQCYVNCLLDELPRSRREIFILSRFQLLSNKAIANKLSISEKTVETQIYRALKFLKSRIEMFIILHFLIVNIN